MRVYIPIVVVIAAFAFCSVHTQTRTWTAIGDSITYLNDHLDETGNRVRQGYMTLVTEKLKQLQYTNQGHNGWTTWQIAERIEELGLQRSDIYSVFLGTNDWWQGYPLGAVKDYSGNTGTKTTCGALRVITDKIRTLNPGAKIVLITPMKRVDFVYLDDKHNNAYGSYREKNGQSLEQFALAIDSIGKQEKIPVIDLYHVPELDFADLVHFKRVKDPATGQYRDYPYPDFIDKPFNPDTDDYPYPEAAIDITYDGLHPSDKGNRIIADKLIGILGKW